MAIFLLILLLVALSFDFVPFFADFFMRIKIGTLKNEEWFLAASAVAKKWCDKGLPVVPRVAGNRLKIVDILQKNFKSETIQSWQMGAVLLSVNEIEPAAGTETIYKYINRETGEWLNLPERVDFAFLAYAFLSNPYTDTDLIKPAMDSMVHILLKKHDETGSIPYSGNTSHRYVDTIGLVCPFLFSYSLIYNNPKAMEAAISLIKEYEEYGIHKEFKVPVHCFDADSKAPLGLYSWGRGCGWWAMGLAESFRVLNQTEADCFTQEKTVVLKSLLTFVKTISVYQQNDGSFDRNIFARSGADSSATAMIAYALAYVGKLSNNSVFTQCAKNAMNYLFSVTRRNGVVDYSQGDTMGIGFYSGESIVLPAAQGFALKTYITLNN